MSKIFQLNPYSFFILLLFFLCGCDNTATNTSLNGGIECDDLSYINSIFPLIDSTTFLNDDFDRLSSYMLMERNKDLSIKSDFVDRFLCSYQNTCYDKNYPTYYWPIGRLPISKDITMLIYEKDIDKFPLLIDEIYVGLFSSNNCRIVNKLQVFKSAGTGPDFCDEYGFRADKKQVDIKYKVCLPYDPSSEKEKNYRLFSLISESYTVSPDGRFKLLNVKKEKKFYDHSLNEWLPLSESLTND